MRHPHVTRGVPPGRQVKFAASIQPAGSSQYEKEANARHIRLRPCLPDNPRPRRRPYVPAGVGWGKSQGANLFWIAHSSPSLAGRLRGWRPLAGGSALRGSVSHSAPSLYFEPASQNTTSHRGTPQSISAKDIVYAVLRT